MCISCMGNKIESLHMLLIAIRACIMHTIKRIEGTYNIHV